MAVRPIIGGLATSARQQQHASAINIEAWTEQATDSLHIMSISSPSGPRGTSVNLAIPLDENTTPTQHRVVVDPTNSKDIQITYLPRAEPFRRDSLKRREALLKGKEGSRRRQRWENDRLLNNPWAQPPLPSDWEVHPTHPKHTVPYFLAPLWDAGMAARTAASEKKRNAKAKKEGDLAGRVPKELREKLKRTKTAKGLLQDLEEEVRMFVKSWEKKQENLQKEGLHDIDSEDDEIVFVGRSGQMYDMPPSPKSKTSMQQEEEEIKKEKLVFDSLADDHGASFGRWLVHSIASYYGLRTWSVTVGDPARREAYVGIKQMKTGNRPGSAGGELPRPLWNMV